MIVRFEIIENDHIVAALDESLGNVAADEARTAGDEDLHYLDSRTATAKRWGLWDRISSIYLQ